MADSLNDWFTREILVHQGALLRFLAHVWPNRSEIMDLCQETYIRVYESAGRELPSSPRGFLFATAKHLMADRIRRNRVVSIETKGDLDSLNVIMDKVSPEQQVSAQQDLWRLTQVFATLPEEYRQLIWMIKVEQLSQKEVASRLGITAKAVERRLARAVRRLQEAFFASSGGVELPVESKGTRGEIDHG